MKNALALAIWLMAIGCTRTTTSSLGDADVTPDVGFVIPSRHDAAADARDIGSLHPDAGVDVIFRRDVQISYDCFGGFGVPTDVDITDPPPMEQWPRLSCHRSDATIGLVCCPESEVYDQQPNDPIRDGVRCTSYRNCRLTSSE